MGVISEEDYYLQDISSTACVSGYGSKAKKDTNGLYLPKVNREEEHLKEGKIRSAHIIKGAVTWEKTA